MTMQRRALLRAFEAAGKTHPTAETLYHLAKKEQPRISMGTVYRNLADMCARGEVLRISVSDGPDRYDRDLSKHDHAVCRVCGRLFDLPAGVVYIPDRCIPKECRLLDSRLLLQCICSACEKSTCSDI